MNNVTAAADLPLMLTQDKSPQSDVTDKLIVKSKTFLHYSDDWRRFSFINQYTF